VLTGVWVLLVEDDPDSAEMYELGLTQYGAKVVAVGLVRAALDLLERERVDAVVADIHLPDGEGHALAHALRAVPPQAGGGVPIIALTGESRPTARQRALEAGFAAFCVKPCPPDELAHTIARVLGRD